MDCQLSGLPALKLITKSGRKNPGYGPVDCLDERDSAVLEGIILDDTTSLYPFHGYSL